MSADRQAVIEQAIREGSKMYSGRDNSWSECAGHVERAVRKYDHSRGRHAMPNTFVLCFVLGWQGGTIHQVAKALGTTTADICDADIDRMGELCRQAQDVARKERVMS